MSNGDDPVLDPQAVLRSFSSSFRGYDSEQVDAHLRSIADALRARAGIANIADTELEHAQARIDALTAEIVDLEAKAAAAPVAEAAAAPVVEAAPFDEARAMQLLGEETTRVLETARQSAATIVANAEGELRRRTEAVDAMQAKVNLEMAELRKSTDTELAEARSQQEVELSEARERIEGEISSRDATSRREADERVAAATEEASKILADAQAAADELASGAARASTAAREDAAALVAAATAEAAQIEASAGEAAASAEAEADTNAARIRAEAEADALAAQESARETARLMVVEAQRVREKVLNDLVVRRRQGRQQVDQAKAARDRLGRALADVRRQLDGSIKELDVALPQAKAALSALATPDAPTDDEAQIRELEIELDAARARANEPHVVVASGSAALAPARNKPKPAPPPADVAEMDRDASTEVADSSESDRHLRSEDAAASVAETTASDSVTPGSVAAESLPSHSAAADSVGSDSPASVTAESEANASEAGLTDAAGSSEVDADSGADADADADAEAEIDVPAPFVARDVAMIRHGADLRRKLKRVMADEQSDLLDRLQRSKDLSVDDLAPVDGQRALYMAAVRPAIVAVANLGADLHGGSIAERKVDPLVTRLVADVFDALRNRVEGSVAAAADVDDVLEPLRAHYRDVRLSDVPDLTDDALAEAFALGGHSAIAKGTPVRWISDPRFEPSSDCFDDTLAADVLAPGPFPTGRTHPTGQPGCRCLVVPVS